MSEVSRITLSRQRLGMTKGQLAAAVGCSLPTLRKYEAGTEQLSATWLSAFSKVLKVSPDFLLRDPIADVPEEAISYRAKSKMSARQLDRSQGHRLVCFEINDWTTGNFDLPTPKAPDLQATPPDLAAAMVRSSWGLGHRPIAHLIQTLEAHGIRVLSTGDPGPDIDAFSFWRDGVPFIISNSSKTAERLRFDLAHELGHLVLHGAGVAGTDNSKEAEASADTFAGNFLMPKDSVLSAGLRDATPARILERKHIWGVSAMALTRRLYELDLISDWRYRDNSVKLAAQGYRTAEPHGLVREHSKLFEQIFDALKAEGTSVASVARKIGIPADELRAKTMSSRLVPVG